MKISTILSLFIAVISLQSCNGISPGKIGNGTVIKEERPVSESFSAIKSSAGIDVFLTQGNENAIVVETDENLQPYVETTVENNVLKIHPTTPIRRSKVLKVHVTFINLEQISASSASSIRSVSEIKSRNLTVQASSGADIMLEVFSEDINVNSSSGSDIRLSGKTISLTANSSSGSSIKAQELQAIRCVAKASSGSDIYLDIKEELNATASSGADIRFSGNPTVSSKQSSGGSVKNRN